MCGSIKRNRGAWWCASFMALINQFKSVGSQGHVFVKFMNTYHFGSAIRAYASWKTTTKAQVKKDICSTLQMIWNVILNTNTHVLQSYRSWRWCITAGRNADTRVCVEQRGAFHTETSLLLFCRFHYLLVHGIMPGMITICSVCYVLINHKIRMIMCLFFSV